jgi:hypothetical protein
MCADDAELGMLTKDSFAADYQDDEYTLLGMAAGLRGKEVRVIGKNRSTLNSEEEKIPYRKLSCWSGRSTGWLAR